jgi:hypothetical protein
VSEATKKPVGAPPDAPDPAHLLAMIQELQAKCQQLEAEKRTAGAEPLISAAESFTDIPPKTYKVMAPYVQYRRKNTENRRFGTRTSPWIIEGGHHGTIISDELIHPDDLAHLLRQTTPVRVIRDRKIVREEHPFLVELPAAIEGGSR